jgi:hypothetical protein
VISGRGRSLARPPRHAARHQGCIALTTSLSRRASANGETIYELNGGACEARRLVWAFGAVVDPSLNQSSGCLLRAWSGLTARAWIPSPSHEIILCNVLLKQSKISTAISIFVFDLPTNLADGFSFPRHLKRSQPPPWVAGDALISRTFAKRIIRFSVAARAVRADEICCLIFTPDSRPVFVVLCPLMGVLSRRMAIHASRIHKDPANFDKHRSRACGLVGDSSEIRGRP